MCVKALSFAREVLFTVQSIVLIVDAHFTLETFQLLIVLLSLEGKHFSMTQIIARVSCTAR